MDKQLHIVCWNIPYPADFGGAIEVYYKIKALHSLGVTITLHCFAYGKRQTVAPELQSLCDKIFVYQRKPFINFLFSRQPFIVASRKNEELINNLCCNDAPILFEGTHCTAWLNDPRLKNRKKIVRAHNVESEYYHGLATSEKSFLKRTYYAVEASRLQHYEKQLSAADCIACISSLDLSKYAQLLPENKVQLLRAFNGLEHKSPAVNSTTNDDKFILCHGNYQVAENCKATQWVCAALGNLDVPIVIAGQDAQKVFGSIQNKNIRIVDSPSTAQMLQLLNDAHIHAMYASQISGVKLKLIYALSYGKHVICNSNMLHGSDISNSVHIANTSNEWIDKTQTLWSQDFTSQDAQTRMQELENYNDSRNAQSLLAIINK